MKDLRSWPGIIEFGVGPEKGDRILRITEGFSRRVEESISDECTEKGDGMVPTVRSQLISKSHLPTISLVKLVS